jgi:hypothetical protein
MLSVIVCRLIVQTLTAPGSSAGIDYLDAKKSGADRI